jgi:hypothetical protein
MKKIKYPFYYGTLDYYTSSHFTDKGLDIHKQPRNRQANQMFFHACNGRSVGTGDDDYIIYYPLDFLPKEWQDETFLKKYEKILTVMGCPIVYEGIHKPTIFPEVSGGLGPISNQDSILKTYNASVKATAATQGHPNYQFNNGAIISKYSLKQTQDAARAVPKEYILFNYEEMTHLEEIKDPRFVFWRIKRSECNYKWHTYWCAILIRSIFSSHYRPAIQAMLEIKKACPKFMYTTCFQLANYTCNNALKKFRTSVNQYHGYYAGYWTHLSGDPNKVYHLLTKEEILQSLRGGTVTKKHGDKQLRNNVEAMNRIFCDSQMAVSGVNYYDLVDLYEQGEYKKMYEKLRCKSK